MNSVVRVSRAGGTTMQPILSSTRSFRGKAGNDTFLSQRSNHYYSIQSSDVRSSHSDRSCNDDRSIISIMPSTNDYRPVGSCKLLRRSFATSSSQSSNEKKDDDKQAEKQSDDVGNGKKEPSLEETIRKMKEKEGVDGDETASPGSSSIQNDVLRQVVSVWDKFREEVGKAWDELVTSGERKSINKKIHPVETREGDAPYTGPVEIMIIDESEHLTAWQKMQRRLSDAPIIQDLLERSEKIYHESGAAKVKERVDVIKEDAREAWETSQNPWVYRASSVYDTLTAESPESIAVAELRKLDPEFTLEDWRQDVVEHTLPSIMQWFLEGRINQLKPWLGENVFKRLAAEMKAREKEGLQIDTNVLAIMNSEILAVEVSAQSNKFLFGCLMWVLHLQLGGSSLMQLVAGCCRKMYFLQLSLSNLSLFSFYFLTAGRC